MLTLEETVDELKKFYKNNPRYQNVSIRGNSIQKTVDVTYNYGLFGNVITLKVQIIPAFNQILKRLENDIRDYRAFDVGELKFFDLLGFELDPLFAKITEQEISDWWDYK